MEVLYLVLYIVAAILFALASFAPTATTGATARFNLVALGLLAWVLVPLIQTIDGLGT